MQEIKAYIVLAVLVWLWSANMFGIINKKVEKGFEPRNRFFRFIGENKPFNCGICLSFWIGIFATCITFNILFLTLPVTYKILNKYL